MSKNISSKSTSKSRKEKAAAKVEYASAANDYLYQMDHVLADHSASHWFQMLPVLFFTAVIIVFTRMVTYERPMSQFFWSSNSDNLSDFFCYFKMIMIVSCTTAVLLIILYKAMTQSLAVKRSFAYIPMIVYSVLVLLSYGFSDYKEFALWGWNDRFEGTIILLCYMVMLFYIINAVNTENHVRWLVNALAVVSTLLGLLGLTQATGYDFFQTTFGKKLITPTWFWSQIDKLNFTFKNNEIYQTVFNINYVSFYLTLLIPIFGMLFIWSVISGKKEPLYKKLVWGAVFALLIYNLIGSASSGGLMGMAVVILVALIVLNKKILHWWKPVVFLLTITVIIGVISYDRWLPEVSKAISGVNGTQTAHRLEKNQINHKIDYMETKGDTITLGYQGEQVLFKTYSDDPQSVSIEDSTGDSIPVQQTAQGGQLQDERFGWITVRSATDKKENHYLVIRTDGHEWPFRLTADGPKYTNSVGKIVDLRKVPAVGWKDNQAFGTGRGYIWSRTIPVMKDTIVLGHGADTFCIYFPQDDYVGKYDSGVFSGSMGIVVDKPHNMYFGAIIGTGGISLLALLVLWGIYVVQGFRIYWRRRYENFLSFTGVGIFLGIFGFLVSGLVNDSSVSVMPMFYGLLGTGIAVNMMLKRDAA